MGGFTIRKSREGFGYGFKTGSIDGVRTDAPPNYNLGGRDARLEIALIRAVWDGCAEGGGQQ